MLKFYTNVTKIFSYHSYNNFRILYEGNIFGSRGHNLSVAGS